MAVVGFEQEEADASVKTVADLTVPGSATHAEIQADTNHVRYTMDGATNPTSAIGMLFLTTSDPKLFLIEDVKNMRFTRDGVTTNGNLNISYVGGRDI